MSQEFYDGLFHATGWYTALPDRGFSMATFDEMAGVDPFGGSAWSPYESPVPLGQVAGPTEELQMSEPQPLPDPVPCTECDALTNNDPPICGGCVQKPRCENCGAPAMVNSASCLKCAQALGQYSPDQLSQHFERGAVITDVDREAGVVTVAAEAPEPIVFTRPDPTDFVLLVARVGPGTSNVDPKLAAKFGAQNFKPSGTEYATPKDMRDSGYVALRDITPALAALRAAGTKIRAHIAEPDPQRYARLEALAHALDEASEKLVSCETE